MATYTLRRLLLLGKQKAIGEDERLFLGADLIGHLWAVVQRAKIYVAGGIPEGESPEVTDALIEDVLARPWQHSDLKEKGYWKTDLSLLELAYERNDDDPRQQRIEVSNLIDLSSGDILQAIAHRPYKGVNPIPEQPSYTTPLKISEAAVYPGFLNRRVQWDKSAETIGRASPATLETAYGLAVGDFAAVLTRFAISSSTRSAPREAVFLLQCEHVGRIGDRAVVIEDAAGVRIEAADQRKDYSNVANLARAMGMLGRDKPAVLVRMFVQPMPNTIVVLPLAALTAKQHLRLGL